MDYNQERAEQLEYELETDASAQALRLQRMIQGAKEGDLSMPRAARFLARASEAVQEVLERHAAVVVRGNGAKYRKWLRALPFEVSSVLSIREVLRQCSRAADGQPVGIQTLCAAVGQLWELELRVREAQRVNPVYMQHVRENIKEHSTRSISHLRSLFRAACLKVFDGEIRQRLTRVDMVSIGKFGVDACLKAGIIVENREYGKGGTILTYRLAPEVKEFLEGYTMNDVRRVISTDDTRMLCPPDPWTNLMDGGYLSVHRKAVAPLLHLNRMRESVRATIAEAFTAEKMPKVFACGNFLQAQAFRMHGPTKTAILRVWERGGRVMGVPSRNAPELPIFPLPADFKSAEATAEQMAIFNQWKRATAARWDSIRKWRGQVREIGGFLRATKDLNRPIWFPTYFDSRGRWYYRGVPNPQGSDMSKAVLHFDVKKPLGKRGVFWLKVHIANCFGYDKERNVDRARWTEQHWADIERALDHPEDAPEVFGDDSPWCMFSAAWELREAYRSGNPETYCTGIPVHMDATCSGLQHLSAVLRDPVGGLYVNLIDESKCGPKQDIYARVATLALQSIKKDMDSLDERVKAMATWAYDVGIPRSLAKKPVMTFVYGATLRGTADFVETTLAEEILPELGKTWADPVLAYRQSMYIAKKLFAGIEATVPAAAAAMRWLKSVARQMPNGTRMAWHTPTGFWVQHDYQAYEEKRVYLNSCNVEVTRVRKWTEGTRSIAMQNAIAPNFVHSMDASHLTLVANQMEKDGCSMVTIHDSFGTHPCDVDTMHKHIREQFYELYSHSNRLAEFLWEVEGMSEVPTRGTLDLRSVLDSEFMFC